MSERVIAIIPAKAFSRRVPNKNMRLFNGKPLLAYTVDQALKSRMVNEVYVSTDSEEIQTAAKSWGALVPFLRPPEFSADHVHGSVPILHMLETVGGSDSYCVQLLATSPLKTAATIDAIVSRAVESKANVLSVTPTGKVLPHFRQITSEGRLKNVTEKVILNFQTQDLPEVFCINGAIYCAPAAELLRQRTFQYGDPIGFPMNPIEAIDIDTEADFVLAETVAGLLARGLIRL